MNGLLNFQTEPFIVVGFGERSRRYMRFILSESLDMVKVSFFKLMKVAPRDPRPLRIEAFFIL